MWVLLLSLLLVLDEAKAEVFGITPRRGHMDMRHSTDSATKAGKLMTRSDRTPVTSRVTSACFSRPAVTNPAVPTDLPVTLRHITADVPARRISSPGLMQDTCKDGNELSMPGLGHSQVGRI